MTRWGWGGGVLLPLVDLCRNMAYFVLARGWSSRRAKNHGTIASTRRPRCARIMFSSAKKCGTSLVPNLDVWSAPAKSEPSMDVVCWCQSGILLWHTVAPFEIAVSAFICTCSCCTVVCCGVCLFVGLDCFADSHLVHRGRLHACGRLHRCRVRIFREFRISANVDPIGHVIELALRSSRRSLCRGRRNTNNGTVISFLGQPLTNRSTDRHCMWKCSGSWFVAKF